MALQHGACAGRLVSAWAAVQLGVRLACVRRDGSPRMHGMPQLQHE